MNAQLAFDEYWFGARSLARVKILVTNMRARFSAFPSALATLHSWEQMSPDTRRVICHWHLQLTDPLYRSCTGVYLAERRYWLRPEVTRDLVVGWVGDQAGARWRISMRIELASKLLAAAHSAALVTTIRDPRPLGVPRVPDEALEYLLYLLRETEFEGSMLDNPYLRSVGLEGAILDERLRRLPGLAFKRQGDLVDFGWKYHNLRMWADVNIRGAQPSMAGAAW
ncbi:hypothetical protein O7605_13750 [Verrucosispora sp. WMMA2121]|uniref:hypothetical protein n=1 Tax=Verrucosispora sp. WMMA2121 TaxID=3015164 RepID=UPI0022B714E8|nr:hypothetical protein [Verrucosispora sp. WMMA2121]MCZ7420580.1 hypothetical protein [Verrucosispora sp. WMMA2121]